MEKQESGSVNHDGLPAAEDASSAELAAIEAIRQLKARYFRCIDTQAWDELREVFLPDAVFDFRSEAPEAYQTDIGAFVGMLRTVLAGAVTVHHGHTAEILLRSADEASALWAMEDRIWWPDGSTLHGYGHYHDVCRRGADGCWRIAATRLTRMRREHKPTEI
jgi:hypothetical protein